MSEAGNLNINYQKNRKTSIKLWGFFTFSWHILKLQLLLLTFSTFKKMFSAHVW